MCRTEQTWRSCSRAATICASSAPESSVLPTLRRSTDDSRWPPQAARSLPRYLGATRSLAACSAELHHQLGRDLRPNPAVILSSLFPIFSFRVWGHLGKESRGAEVRPPAPLLVDWNRLPRGL